MQANLRTLYNQDGNGTGFILTVLNEVINDRNKYIIEERLIQYVYDYI